MTLQVRIADPSGQTAPRDGEAWLLEEASRWRVWVEGGPCEGMLEQRPLAWDPDLSGFTLDLRFAVGHLSLELRRGDLRKQVPLRVRPAQGKLGEAAWMAMLSDLEGWLTGLTTGAEGPRQGAVGLAGVAAPLLAEALLPLLPALERALRQVLDEPRLRAQDRLQDTPLHRTRAADQETVAWLARRPHVAGWLDPVRSADLAGPPPVLPQRSTTDTLDHPANRHVAWLVDRVVRRLRDTASLLAAHTGSKLNDHGAWARARAHAVEKAADRLDRLRKRSFLRQLQPTPASEGAMLVVLDHPLYARVHRLARRVLASRFALSNAADAATRPSFELYELWCFFRVKALLAQTNAGRGLSWQVRGLSKLLALDGTGSGARAIGRDNGAGLRVQVRFNPVFPGYFRRKQGSGPHSLSGERRPDVVVTVERGDKRRWLVLDAKYRVGATNLGSALGSVHVYRDALRWPRFGGPSVGGFLLAPRRTEDAEAWFEPEFHDAHGFGILELRPGAEATPTTMRVLQAVLEEEWPAT